MEKPILWIVIPCYNEQEVLPETVKRLGEKLTTLIEAEKISPNSRMLFVNDGSKDETLNESQSSILQTAFRF